MSRCSSVRPSGVRTCIDNRSFAALEEHAGCNRVPLGDAECKSHQRKLELQHWSSMTSHVLVSRAELQLSKQSRALKICVLMMRA